MSQTPPFSKRLKQTLTRKPRLFVQKVVRETVKEAKVTGRGFRRDALAAAYFLQLDLLSAQGVESGVHEGQPRDKKIVVSLTTIPARLFDIHTTIESLLRQTLKPDAIVLWLDETRISDADLPLRLKDQMKRGVEVRFCQDIGPHTKLIPALRAFPDSVVITVDDDILYPSNLVERLVYNHRKYPSEILCFRARRIHLPGLGPTIYSQHWPNQLSEASGLDIVPLGVGGVLYPPDSLDPEVFNLSAQRELSPKADDIWFKAMSLRAGVACRRIDAPTEPHPIRPNSQDVGLEAFNVGEGGNDAQIQAAFDRYDLWRVLKATGVTTYSPA